MGSIEHDGGPRKRPSGRLSRNYYAIHKWLSRNREKVGECDLCGARGETQWANRSGEYRHPREDPWDWSELCLSCHRKRDAASRPDRVTIIGRHRSRLG